MALFGKKTKGATEDAAPVTPAAEMEPAAPAKPKEPSPRPDVYTLILGLSVAALVIATLLLYLNVSSYGPNPLSGIPRG